MEGERRVRHAFLLLFETLGTQASVVRLDMLGNFFWGKWWMWSIWKWELSECSKDTVEEVGNSGRHRFGEITVSSGFVISVSTEMAKNVCRIWQVSRQRRSRLFGLAKCGMCIQLSYCHVSLSVWLTEFSTNENIHTAAHLAPFTLIVFFEVDVSHEKAFTLNATLGRYFHMASLAWSLSCSANEVNKV